MEEWKEYKLGDLIESYKSGDWGKELYDEKYSNQVYCIRGADLNDIAFGDARKMPIRFILKKNFEEKKLQKNDLVIEMSGGSPTQSTGRIALIKESTINKYNDLICSNFCKAIKLNERIAFPYYFYYFWQHLYSKGFFFQYENGTTGIKNLNLAGLLSGESFLLPNISTQKRIVSILKSLDDKIENNRRINENLEQQAQALFKSWFVDFEPFKDGEFVESELGMIPKGWRVGSLDELCNFISRGLTPKYDENSNELILGQTCVRNNIVTLNNARRHNPKAKTEKWVQQWDILLNSTGIGSLGRVGIVYFQKDNVAIDSHITVVRTSNTLYRHYVGRNLLSRQLEIENMAVGSTGQTELPRERVKAMPIIIPDDGIMEKFNYVIEPIALTIYKNIDESRRLAELRDTLLPKLMSGELKVDEINI